MLKLVGIGGVDAPFEGHERLFVLLVYCDFHFFKSFTIFLIINTLLPSS